MRKTEKINRKEELMNTYEMSKLLGISKKTLLEWVKNYAIPFLRINKTIRFQGSKVLESINVKQSHKNGDSKNG